jgi:ketosteroid isomerase-like protein
MPAAAVCSAWAKSFNARDLEGMLALMDMQVVFHPLRLDGIAREYHGQDGVREWFGRLQAMGHEHRLRLREVRSHGDGQAVGFGDVLEPDGSVLAPFWSLERLRGGRIVAAYHYLTDPDIMEYVRGGAS